MSLVPGQRLGVHEVVARIGAGGMGEVYRATDTRLGRDVALKVLPAAFSSDADRRARFAREARLLASLNHPNIAQVYGFESVGQDGGSDLHFLGMELVEGEDLAQRLARGPIPVDEAIAIAMQIAAALEEAHEKGIIHRDLKPANVKVTPDGKVKVLDFGLAKAWEGDRAAGSGSDLSQSPTLAHTGTQAGIILGTAAYMSPEQARGKAVDKRADIWAFGVALFEMLTGRRLFDGETVSDVLAAVLKTEPAWSELPPATPGPIRELLRRCLERNPRNRLHHIADARIVIEETLAGRLEPPAAAVAPPARGGRRRMVGLALGVAAALAIGLLAGWMLGWRGAQAAAEMRFPLALPAGWKLADADTPLLAISRDGRRRAFVGALKEGRQVLFVAESGQLDWRELPGTEGGRAPFFSPDGAWVGYFGQGTLMRVAFEGGPPIAMAAPTGAQIRGAVWLPDGSIVYSPDAEGGLFRAREGEPQPKALTTLGPAERTHRWPDALPDGSAVLFTSDTGDSTEFYDDASIEAVVPKTGQRKTVLRASSMARYVDPDILVFARGGTLFATRFDPRSLEIRGTPVPVLQGVATTVVSGAVQFTPSVSGDLFWSPGDLSRSAGGRPVWVDSQGTHGAPLVADGSYVQLDLSPDGRRLALVANEAGKTDIWVVDVEKAVRSRLTFEGDVSDPTWTPDGKRVMYVRNGAVAGGGSDIYWKPADGSGPAEPLVAGPEPAYAPSLSPDGRTLLYDTTARASTGADLWMMPIVGERTPRPFAVTPGAEFAPRFSPDGRYVAHVGHASGRLEIFVRAFPAGGGMWQVSREGGFEPQWSRDGRVLYYRRRETLYRVPVDTRDTFSAGTPERIATGMRTSDNNRSYAPHPDGARIVALPGWEASNDAPQINLAIGWSRDVRRRLGLRP